MATCKMVKRVLPWHHTQTSEMNFFVNLCLIYENAADFLDTMHVDHNSSVTQTLYMWYQTTM